MGFWQIAGAFWLAAIALPFLPVRGIARFLPVAGLLTVCFTRGMAWEPWQKLLMTGLILLYVLKAAIASREGRPLGFGHLLFFTIWPGMDPKPFTDPRSPQVDSGHRFAKGWWKMLWGIAAIIGVALAAGSGPRVVIEWAAVFALVFAVHFGYSGVLTGAMKLAGYPVKPLFDDPFLSASLTDFWTRRWNRAFVEMNRLLFIPPLARKFGMRWAVVGTFLISGLLHEFAISYPVGTGYGLPMLYFVIQAAGVFLERSIRNRFVKRAFAWILIILPMPLLFHTAFREAFIYGPFLSLHRQLTSIPLERLFSYGIWAMGLGHFLILAASFQVPARLKWKEDLAQLTTFNRKLMWTYAVFVVFTVISFGCLTLLLRNELIEGTPAALGICGLIFGYWVLRVIVDYTYYAKEDWPKGVQFEIGHTLLNSLFFFLVGSYGGLLLWHTVPR